MIPLYDDNPTRSFSFVTITLIVINVVAFFYELSLPAPVLEQLVHQYGLVPAAVTQRGMLSDYGTVFTSMFLHGGWAHLIGNMLYLWIFGNNIEDAVGHGRFIVFYLLCGSAAAAAQIVVSPLSTVPMIGASGAVSGVLGAYLLLFPRARVLILVPIWIFLRFVYVPAMLMLILWFALQLLSGLLDRGMNIGGGVAFWAHIGGFVTGLLLIPLFKKRRVRLFR